MHYCIALLKSFPNMYNTFGLSLKTPKPHKVFWSQYFTTQISINMWLCKEWGIDHRMFTCPQNEAFPQRPYFSTKQPQSMHCFNQKVHICIYKCPPTRFAGLQLFPCLPLSNCSYMVIKVMNKQILPLNIKVCFLD